MCVCVCVCLGVLYTHKSIMTGASSLLVKQREQCLVFSRAPRPPCPSGSPPACLSGAGTGSREEEKKGRKKEGTRYNSNEPPTQS